MKRIWELYNNIYDAPAFLLMNVIKNWNIQLIYNSDLFIFIVSITERLPWKIKKYWCVIGNSEEDKFPQVMSPSSQILHMQPCVRKIKGNNLRLMIVKKSIAKANRTITQIVWNISYFRNAIYLTVTSAAIYLMVTSAASKTKE